MNIRKFIIAPAIGDIWVGSQFPRTRVLILGESTYGTTAPLPSYIPDWCRRQIPEPDQTLSRIFNAFSGHDASSATVAQREEFWASVAFANFVEQPVGAERSHRPTSEHYRAAASTLPELLERLKPSGVLILGREQSQYSEPVVRAAGIPCVVCPHPTAYGISTAKLKSGWDELQSKIRNANHALQPTAPAVTLAASTAAVQPARQPPPSLSLGSLGSGVHSV